MDKLEFGQYLRKLRGDMSTREVENLVGISRSYISLLENGKREIPTPTILKKLAQAYNVSYEELMKTAGHIEYSSLIDTATRVISEYMDDLEYRAESVKLNNLEKEELRDYRAVIKIAKNKGISPEQLEKIIDFLENYDVKK